MYARGFKNLFDSLKYCELFSSFIGIQVTICLKTLFLKHQGWIIPKWIIFWMSSLLIDSWMLSQLKDSSTVKELKVINKMGEGKKRFSLKGIKHAFTPRKG